MTGVEPAEYASVLETIRRWPPETRRGLLQDVIHSLAEERTTPSRRGVSADQAAGLLKTDRPAPTDEECDRILEEELMKKYSR
jgi:hypothetical protein